MSCIAPKRASHPENHDAICSDPAELAAQKSFHRDESGIQAVQSGAVAFVVIFDPWFHNIALTRVSTFLISNLQRCFRSVSKVYYRF